MTSHLISDTFLRIGHARIEIWSFKTRWRGFLSLEDNRCCLWGLWPGPGSKSLPGAFVKEATFLAFRENDQTFTPKNSIVVSIRNV